MKPIDDIKKMKLGSEAELDLRAVFEMALEAEEEMTRVAEREMALEAGFEIAKVVPEFQAPRNEVELILEEWETVDPEMEEVRMKEVRRKLRRWGGLRKRVKVLKEMKEGAREVGLGMREDAEKMRRMGERLGEVMGRGWGDFEIGKGRIFGGIHTPLSPPSERGEEFQMSELERKMKMWDEMKEKMLLERLRRKRLCEMSHLEKVKKSWWHQPGLTLGMGVMLLMSLGISGMMAGGKVLERVKMEAGAMAGVADDFLENPNPEKVMGAVLEMKESLGVIEANLREVGILPNYFENHSFFETGDELLRLAEKLAEAGERGAEMLELLGGMSVAEVLDGEQERGLELGKMKGLFSEVVKSVSEAREISEGVETWMIPGKEGEQVEKLKEKLPEIEEALQEGEKWLSALLRVLGSERPMKWLVVLQNSGELRATGGFVGSLAILTADDGRVEIEMKDVYDFDGQLAREIPAPPGILEVSDRLFLRDANYWPDFPTSALMMSNLFEESGGPTVDGVVAVCDTILGDLLELTGPIVLEDLDVTFDKKWWWWQLVKVIEAKETGLTTPKVILFELVEEVKKKVAELGEWKKMAEILIESLLEKEVQMWVRDDEEISGMLRDLGIDGRMRTPLSGEDWLHVSRTNIGGNKSDKMMKEKVMSSSKIEADGTVMDTLSMKRWHGWTWDFEQEVRKKFGLFAKYEWLEKVVHIMGKGENRTFWRIFVPRGSELERVSGIGIEDVEVSQDGGFTVFAFVTQTAPENVDQWSLQWELPWKVERGGEGWIWKWDQEKQAGVSKSEMLRSLEVDESWCIEGEDLGCEREILGEGGEERLLILGR